jgi:hypothetical protein
MTRVVEKASWIALSYSGDLFLEESSAKTILENAAGALVASALASQIIPHLLRYLP